MTNAVNFDCLSNAERYKTFDLLATLVAVVHTDEVVLFANAALEDALGISRRSIVGSHFSDSFTQPEHLRDILKGVGNNDFAALRYDAFLLRVAREVLPVHVIVTPTEGNDIIVE